MFVSVSTKFLLLSVLAALSPIVSAKPTGSTVCVTNPALLTRMADSGAMGPSSNTLPVSITMDGTSYTPGATTPMSVTVTAGAPIQGILLYAESKNGGHVGSFAVPNANFRSLALPDCQNELPTSSLTHSNPTAKGTTMTFSWMPPKAGQGDLSIKALVVTDSANGFAMAAPKLVSGPGTPQTVGGSGPVKASTASKSNPALPLTFLGAFAGLMATRV